MNKDNITEGVVAILTLIVGVAVVAILVSNKANTVGVIQAAASGFGNALNVAVSPVTGASIQGTLAYPTSNSAFGSLSLPNINGLQ